MVTEGREYINHSFGILRIIAYSCAIDTGVSLFKVMEYALNLRSKSCQHFKVVPSRSIRLYTSA
jgi:hypothetical protein